MENDKQIDDTDSLADFSEEQLALEIAAIESASVPVTIDEPASGPVTLFETETDSVVVTVGGPVTTVASLTESVISSLIITDPVTSSTRGLIPQPPAPVRASPEDGSVDEYFSCQSESEQDDNHCQEHTESVTASAAADNVHMLSAEGKSIHIT